MTPPEQILLGLFSGIFGVVVGSIITAWLTYRFQKRLLDLQLEEQNKSHAQLMKWLHDDFLLGLLTRWNTTFQGEIYPRFDSTLDKLDKALDKVTEEKIKPK